MEGLYKRGKGNAGLDGVQFQIDLTVLFLLNALRHFEDWRISTENVKAGKFDDAVIELSDGSAVLLQAKCKSSKRISKDQLISTNSKNSDFSLPKYFLSYQEIKSEFNVKNVIICTNTDIDKNELEDCLAVQQASPDNLLHLEGEDCSFITFNENILSDLRENSEKYYDSNLRGKGIDKDAISDENLRGFLEKLQFFTNYPSGDKLEKIINDKLLPCLTSSELWRGTSYTEIYGKVEAWFKEGRGQYLTELHANAMFCEIKSDQFCKTLKDYDVSFTSTDFGLEERESMFHISAEGGYLLQALKTFHTPQEQITLFVNPDDGVEVYRQAIGAFKLRKYQWLILILHKNIHHKLICEKMFELKDILKTCSYKKVLLIANKQNVQQSVLKDGIFEIDGSVKFSYFTETCREKLVRKANIIYQGRRTTLRELLGASSDEDYDTALDSEVLEKLVKGEEIKVGASLGSLDPNIVRYYINRTIEREVDEKENGIRSGTRKYRFTEEDIFEVKDKCIIISDCAGMGKTTVLAKLAENVKEKYPHLWVIRIELNEYSKILRDWRRSKKRNVEITELLDSNEATRINNLLEMFVFSMYKKVVVMLDGLDEISPDYTELVLSLLEQCQEGANFAKVFVTTRPHMNRELEDLLSVKPFLLQPFSTEDQIAFLASYWGHRLGLNDSNTDKCEQYAVALISKMSSWLKNNDNFTAIPLHVRMLAEIFQENWEEEDAVEWESCKEFLVGTEQEPKLPERMKICELYETFLEIKWNISLDKANPTGTASGNISHEFQSDKCFKNHQSLALQEILNGEDIHNKGIGHLFLRFQYDKDMESRMLKIGIVQMTNGKLEFVHRTFSEYFLAKSILEISELKQGKFNKNVAFQELFINEILCNPQNTVVRAFLESELEDTVDSLPGNIFKKYRRLNLSIPKFPVSGSNLLHLLAGEGHVSIFKLMLKSINFKEYVVVWSERRNTLKILRRLFRIYGVDIKDRFRYTPLHYAIKEGHLNMVRYLVGQGANIKNRNHKGESVIHVAAYYGHLEITRFFTEHGADVTAVNDDGYTALHYAARVGHLDVCKLLLEKGVDANFRDGQGYTALLSVFPEKSSRWATWNTHLEAVKLLTEHGADISAAGNSDGCTALHYAAEQDLLDVCMFLLERGVDVNVRDERGCTPLHLASGNGHLDIVKWLVECGHADVKIANNEGFTALHRAAQEDHLDVCKFLVEEGVDVNLREKYDYTTLHVASLEGRSDVVKLLVECGHANVNAAIIDGSTALHCAALEGHLDVCKILVEGGVDVNARQKCGLGVVHWSYMKCQPDYIKWVTEPDHAADNGDFIALHWAALGGHFDICKFLVERGADVNVCDKDGVSPLHFAAGRGHSEVVKWLVECGHADINVADNNGDTPLHYAVEVQPKWFEEWGNADAAPGGYLNVCKFLIEGGVDVNVCNKNGISALHSAAKFGHTDIVKWLVECGHADVNVASNDGSTALHHATQEGHLDVCRCLVEGGVNVNLHDKHGFTALHLASLWGRLNIVKCLVECGHADVSVADDDGCTALHIAVLGHHLNVCKFLVDGSIDVNLRDKHGFSALHLASLCGRVDIVKCLVECGHAEVNITSNDGSTAFHCAAKRGHSEVCKFLKSGGVDVNFYSVILGPLRRRLMARRMWTRRRQRSR